MPVETALLLDALRAVAAALLVGTVGYTLRRRDEPVAVMFLWMVLSMTLWAGLTVLPGTFGSPTATVFGGQALVGLATFVAGLCTAVLAFVYVRQYTGHNQYTTRRRVGRLFLPVAAAVAVAGGQPALQSVSPALARVSSVVFLVVYGYAGVLLVLGLYSLGRLARRYRQVSYRQVTVLGVGLVAPYASVVAGSLSRPAADGTTTSLLPVDISFAGFLVAGVAFPYAIRAYPLFTAFPESARVARDEVLEDLAEGVLILDTDDRILDLNAAATRICRRDAGDAIGRPVRSVVDGISRLPAEGVSRAELQTRDGRRQFEVSTSTLRNGDGEPLGKTILFRDVTEKQTREQQLEVLTRALRHNLRNGLDAALAHTNDIEDPAVRERVRSKLDNLARLGTKARDVEDVLSTAAGPRSEVDVADLARTVADRLQTDHGDCTVTVDAPETVSFVSQRTLLDRLLTELVENGIEHNTQSSPRVEVTVRETEARGGSVALEIADNGPGIPEQERRVIESGTESPLDHGTGIGLWLANWIVDSLGGELSFDGSASTGGVVTVTLPNVPADTTQG
jgi:PAS domain S-box-containing protein